MKEKDSLQDSFNETMNEIDNIFKNFNKEIDEIYTKHTKDENIESEGVNLNYFNYIAQNIKDNNSRMVKNSFGMLICFVIYFLIDNKKVDSEIEVLFIKISDTNILLSFIPICFTFLFLKNVTIYINNKFLILLFEKVSKNLFKLGKYSYTRKIINPYFFFDNIVLHQFRDYEIKSWIKFPLKFITVICLVFFPLIFLGYSIYRICVDNYFEFTPVVSILLICVLFFGALIHFGAGNNKIKEYRERLKEEGE